MKTNYHQLCIALLAVTVLASTAPATIDVYYNFNDFIAAGVSPTSYYSFDDFNDGDPLDGQTDWEIVFDIDPYGFHAHADLGLWSNPGALSTVDANDPLVFTFENSPLPVMSFGGYFASGDSEGDIINQDLVFTVTDGLDDEVEETIDGSQFAGGSQFIGFISYSLLTQVTLDGVDNPNPNWPQVDSTMWTNSPEPATLVLLALGGCTLLRKRRV